MSVTVTVDNLRDVLANISAMADKQVLVGIPADEASRGGDEETNPSIGFIQEFGSPAKNIPARPFLVPGVRQATPQAIAAMRRFAAEGVTNSAAVERGLTAAGLIAVAAVKRRIVSQEGFAPLSARTLAERSSRGFRGIKALIRTGQLLNSITFVVRGR